MQSLAQKRHFPWLKRLAIHWKSQSRSIQRVYRYPHSQWLCRRNGSKEPDRDLGHRILPCLQSADAKTGIPKKYIQEWVDLLPTRTIHRTVACQDGCAATIGASSAISIDLVRSEGDVISKAI